MTKKLGDKIKKNLLDLQYNKYLQYYNTSTIILFTYVIGVVIGFITFLLFIMLRFKDHQKNIVNEVRKLNVK